MPDDLIEAAVEWLLDCYPDDEDAIRECQPATIRRAVERGDAAGWRQFVADATTNAIRP